MLIHNSISFFISWALLSSLPRPARREGLIAAPQRHARSVSTKTEVGRWQTLKRRFTPNLLILQLSDLVHEAQKDIEQPPEAASYFKVRFKGIWNAMNWLEQQI